MILCFVYFLSILLISTLGLIIFCLPQLLDVLLFCSRNVTWNVQLLAPDLSDNVMKALTTVNLAISIALIVSHTFEYVVNFFIILLNIFDFFLCFSFDTVFIQQWVAQFLWVYKNSVLSFVWFLVLIHGCIFKSQELLQFFAVVETCFVFQNVESFIFCLDGSFYKCLFCSIGF